MTHPFSHDSVWLRQPLSLGPLIVDADHVVDDEDISSFTDDDPCTLAASAISPARNLELVATDASGTNLVVVATITGENQFGQTKTEEITLNTAGSFTDSTDNCFSSISSITLVVTNGAASDVLNIGLGDKIGLPFKIDSVSEVAQLVQVPAAATAATVAAAGSSTYVDLTYDCLKGLTLTAGDVVCVTPQLKSQNSDSRFNG